MNSLDFSQEDVERAASYHRPAYVSFAAGLLLVFTAYAVLRWTQPGRWLWGLVDGLGWAGSAAAWAAIVVTVVELVRLPLVFWRGFLRERRWGFSTQGLGGWAADQLKGWAVGLVLAAAAWTGMVGLARAFPGWWVVLASAAFAAAVLFLSFVAPIVLEPLFNRFRPLDDAQLAGELRSLADDARVPVRDVLVADASRRTTKVNAYVSGIGGTRRVVVYDTLLDEAGQPELEVVVAHELGHRRHRDVAKGTLLAMAGAAVAVLVAWPIDPSPRDVPVLLFVWGLLEVAALPLTAAFSRRLERRADRFALDITHDPGAFETAFRRMAKANLSDLDPPRLAYAFVFTHPTPVERLAAVAS